MRDPVAELEQRARARFARWNARLWDEIVSGPGQRLAASLLAQAGPEEARSLARTYLELAAEGIGEGHLRPLATAPGTRADEAELNFLTLAWHELLPRHLAAVPAPRRAEILAECFNLGENLETQPAWVRRILVRQARELTNLTDLPSLLRRTEQAMQPPEKRIGTAVRLEWVHLAKQDSRFLPGALHFVAPAVVCVHDRHRGAAGGREARTEGIWLANEPAMLGPLGCGESPDRRSALGAPALASISRQDPRVVDVHASAANEWRGAITLDTSQFLVAVLPA